MLSQPWSWFTPTSPSSEPTPSRSAGRESVPVLTKHLAEKKEVQLMTSAQFPGDPGLDGQSCVYSLLSAVTRGFAPPPFCLSPLCPAKDGLQRTVLVCCGRLFSETRSTLRTQR